MLDKRYKPKKIEEKTYNEWEESGFFNPDNLPGEREKTYTLLIPPPNVTGTLHMGHALNVTIQDILTRMKRMQGYKTLWLPGTDHAGIATQTVVEKKLKKEEDKTRFDVGKQGLLERIWDWKEKYGDLILDQLKKMGTSCDWSRSRFTMDDDYKQAVKKAFAHYWEKDMIYPGRRPINWCRRCSTSISDLEVEHKQKQGNLWYIKYPFTSKEGSLKVATTRPETMLGDTAVAVNPQDERFKELIGKKVKLPLTDRKIPVISDQLVDPEFGTGAVKVTPAHDFTDYKIGQNHNLDIIKVIDKKGKITKEVPERFQGQTTQKAKEKVVEELKEKGFLEKTEDYNISEPKCDRCGTTIEVTPSQQWFLKMDKLAEKAKKQVKEEDIEFKPKNFEKVYFNWLDNIHDWCISRQLWWGHQIPVWACQNKEEVSQENFKEKYFLSIEEPEECPVCNDCKPKQVEDVLDTWFSSALWPFATLGWPDQTEDLDNFYPSDVLVTGKDIINLWVSRMIFSGLEFMDEKPFSTVVINPTVLAESGEKMSKSKGNGIDPMELRDKYGTDATRFGLAWQINSLQDIRFNEDDLVMGEKFCNKIWNVARFILMQTDQKEYTKEELHSYSANTKADERIINKLKQTKEEIEKHLDEFEFGKASETLYHFFWDDFSGDYLEKSKNQEQQENTKKILLSVLLDSLKLTHPFMPFITEEIYKKLPIKDKKDTIMIEDWPQHL